MLRQTIVTNTEHDTVCRFSINGLHNMPVPKTNNLYYNNDIGTHFTYNLFHLD